MSVLTPKRWLLVVVLLLSGAPALANNPSPRQLSRIVYDEAAGETVLFGGRGVVDSNGTGFAPGIDETWVLVSSRWSQRFPAVRPEGRAAHAMVYDPVRARTVLFGGFTDAKERNGLPIFRNDTWVWKNDTWTRLETANAPSPRYGSAIAYDSDRDRIVLFGGVAYKADNKTTESIHDTWEFDGTNWTQVAATGVISAGSPQMAYDPSRKQLVLVGVNTSAATAMFLYNAETKTWAAPTPAPEKLPTCAAEGTIIYQKHVQKIAYIGGLCATNTPTAEEVWEWNGTNWVKATVTLNDKATGMGITYDSALNRTLMFGGITYGATAPRSTLQAYANGLFTFVGSTLRPRPRSLGVFGTDSTNGTAYLFGGLNEYGSGYTSDFWRYSGDGQWNPIIITGDGAPPAGCITPSSAFDANRSRWVVNCYGAEMYEWDGTTWKSFTTQKPQPSLRRFASLAYDATLKKVILFGGFDDVSANYRQDTWTWDGTTWAEVKNNRPTHRALATMWYDANLKKTVVYGGLGRANLDQKVIRYEDMWSFDGSGWTKLNVTATPGPRVGAQFAINPNTNRLLLFGGLKADKAELATKQWYDNETWEWNGSNSTWTRLTPATSPDPRENGHMAWDPVNGEMVLFGGYNGGYYQADVWIWNGTNWTPHVVSPGRRRPGGK